MTPKYKRQLILASLVTLLPIPVSLLLETPDGMQPHLRSFAWASVSMALALWLCAWITSKDPGNKGRNQKPLTLVLWVIPIVSNLCCVLTWALAMGYEFNVSALFMAPMGLMFAAIGNYLPKCRMNSTMGIKVCWAYTSEENWNATHRFGGKMWFWGGLVAAVASLLPLDVSIPVIITVFLVMTILPMVYSYRYYQMQKARGDALKPFPRAVGGKKTAAISAVALIALLIFVGVLLFAGDIHYTLGEDHLEIQADFYGDMSLDYLQIQDIQYREESVDGYRASGFGSLRLLMGFFRNAEFGTYTRYTYYEPEACIVLTTWDDILVLSAETAEQTRLLYEGLLEKTA